MAKPVSGIELYRTRGPDGAGRNHSVFGHERRILYRAVEAVDGPKLPEKMRNTPFLDTGGAS
jgi:hypothetical protein